MTKFSLAVTMPQRHAQWYSMTIEMAQPTHNTSSQSHPQINCLCVYFNGLKSKDGGILSEKGETGHKMAIVASPLDGQVEAVSIGSALKGEGYVPGKLNLPRPRRYALAAAAAWGLLYLCGTPWLSQTEWLGAQALELLTQMNGPERKIFDKVPILNQTFKNKTSAANTTGSEVTSSDSTTQPPAHQIQNAQIRNKALFALGVLLTELCLGRSFDKLRVETRNPVESDTSAMIDDLQLVNQLQDRIYDEAGDHYANAVFRCVRCEFPGRDITKNFDFSSFRKDFFEQVVVPVQATFELLPNSGVI